MRRRLLIVCLAFLLLVVVGVLVIHTPPVRSFALRFGINAALRLGIQIEAERLDYNLATRHVRLANVKISAVGDAEPFFVADDVLAAASYRVFLGEVAFDEVTVGNGAVHIVRRTDGTTNLPKSSGGGSGEPAPLPIARVSAPRLAVEYRDESADVTVRAPALTVDLSSRGRLALEAPLDLTVGATGTRIDSFESDAAFDGRDLRLSNLRFECAGTPRTDRRNSRPDQAAALHRRSGQRRHGTTGRGEVVGSGRRCAGRRRPSRGNRDRAAE